MSEPSAPVGYQAVPLATYNENDEPAKIRADVQINETKSSPTNSLGDLVNTNELKVRVQGWVERVKLDGDQKN